MVCAYTLCAQDNNITNTYTAGVSEEQIIDIFSRVGPVISFRLVHDKETGRPKGFGFLEYADVDTASAAVRNLNDHDMMGRKLRVDWSNDGPSNTQATDAPAPMMPQNGFESHDASALPSLPPGTDSHGLSAPDAISKTLQAMPAPQLLDLISQMKGMVAESPAQIQQLFTVAPQLGYAVFQALLLLGLTDVSTLGNLVQAASAQVQQSQQPQQPQYAQPPAPPVNQYPSYPQYQQQAPTPPTMQQPYQPPQQAPQGITPEQAALLSQLAQLTPEQIYALPPAQRDQIIQLRASVGLST